MMSVKHSGVYPVIYSTNFNGKDWIEEYREEHHATYEEEAATDSIQLHDQCLQRNYLKVPIISGSMHYSISAFEGGKAFPQADGSFKLFRPDRNARRFHNSLNGLYIPSPGQEAILRAICTTVGKNYHLGFYPRYDKELEKHGFFGAPSMYIRPFVVGESNLTPATSERPTIIIFCMPLGSFFGQRTISLMVSHRARAIKGGIGWIKSAANYTVSAIGRKEAHMKGHHDALFLDFETKSCVEESSATNFFCVLKDGTLVTPDLGDTILAGITRESVLQIGKDLGMNVQERRLPIQEVLADAKECFVCGTGGGLVSVSAIEYQEKITYFSKDDTPGEITTQLGCALRNIQFGKAEDRHGWMVQPLS